MYKYIALTLLLLPAQVPDELNCATVLSKGTVHLSHIASETLF